MVVQVGDGVTPLSQGAALPPFFAEYATGAPQSAPLSIMPVNIGGANACMLSVSSSPSWLFDQEGIPSLSGDGKLVLFPCYNVLPGGNLTTGAAKIVATLSSARAVTTSTVDFYLASSTTSSTWSSSDLAPRQALRTVVSDGTRLWWAAEGFGLDASLMYSASLYTQSATDVCTYWTQTNAGCIGYLNGLWEGSLLLYGGSLYFSDMKASSGAVGITKLTNRNGLPPVAATPAVQGTKFPGMTGATGGYGFAFQSATVLYMTSTGVTSNFLRWTLTSGVWVAGTPSPSQLLEAGTQIVSLIGRAEGCGVFVLYATSPTKLYSFNTATNVAVTLATAPANTVFRGVTPSPYSSAPVWTCVASSSPTASLTRTASKSKTAAVTPSRSPLATRSGTPAATVTRTGSPASTRSRSGSRTPSKSAAGTASPTGTRSVSRTPAGSRSGSGTPTGTKSGSRSGTGTKTGSK